MLVEKRREDPIPIQWMYITSQNRPARTMRCLWRLILYLESIPIALKITADNAPTSILFDIIPTEIIFDFNRNS